MRNVIMHKKIEQKQFWLESKQFSPQNDLSIQKAHDIAQNVDLV